MGGDTVGQSPKAMLGQNLVASEGRTKTLKSGGLSSCVYGKEKLSVSVHPGCAVLISAGKMGVKAKTALEGL